MPLQHSDVPELHSQLFHVGWQKLRDDFNFIHSFIQQVLIKHL